MKILCTCAQGNNRSVTFAHILRYVQGFEVMTVGLLMNSPETLAMMFRWADVIIVPEEALIPLIPGEYKGKIKYYNVGPDVYPRPFNQALYTRIKRLLDGDHVA